MRPNLSLGLRLASLLIADSSNRFYGEGLWCRPFHVKMLRALECAIREWVTCPMSERAVKENIWLPG